MSGALHFKREDKGCSLVAGREHRSWPWAVHSMSMMDAAETLWNLWDEMRADPIARGCIDDVHARRQREGRGR